MASTSSGKNFVNISKSKRKKKSTDQLLLSNVMCPVCLSILIEPVTMPCNHNLCMPCFQQNVQETSLLCPVCRKRISSWSRKASRDKNLINKELWNNIQRAFPDKVKRRLDGFENDSEGSEDEAITAPLVRISKPGEIRMEYETQLQKMREENEKEREIENQQSSALIKAIQEEEEKKRREAERVLEKDRMIAMLLSQKLKQVPVVEEAFVINNVLSNIDEVLRPATECKAADARPTATAKERPSTCVGILPVQLWGSGSMKPPGSVADESKGDEVKHAGKKKKTSSDEPPEKSTGKLSRSNSIESNDSITPEMRHFRPIKVAPKTPPRRLPDGRVQETPLIHTAPRALTFDMLHPKDNREDVLYKKLTVIEDDRRRRLDAGRTFALAEVPIPVRKLKHFRPLAPVSTSPGNCALGVKPDLKFAKNDLAAGKENPKIAGKQRNAGGAEDISNMWKHPADAKHRRVVEHVPQSTESAVKQKSKKAKRNMLSPKSNSKLSKTMPHASRSKSQSPKSKPQTEKRPTAKPTSAKTDQEMLARKRQEKEDRRLAAQLQKMWNNDLYAVDRRVGTAGEYFLRSQETEVVFRYRRNATTSF